MTSGGEESLRGDCRIVDYKSPFLGGESERGQHKTRESFLPGFVIFKRE